MKVTLPLPPCAFFSSSFLWWWCRFIRLVKKCSVLMSRSLLWMQKKRRKKKHLQVLHHQACLHLDWAWDVMLALVPYRAGLTLQVCLAVACQISHARTQDHPFIWFVVQLGTTLKSELLASSASRTPSSLRWKGNINYVLKCSFSIQPNTTKCMILLFRIN